MHAKPITIPAPNKPLFLFMCVTCVWSNEWRESYSCRPTTQPIFLFFRMFTYFPIIFFGQIHLYFFAFTNILFSFLLYLGIRHASYPQFHAKFNNFVLINSLYIKKTQKFISILNTNVIINQIHLFCRHNYV